MTDLLTPVTLFRQTGILPNPNGSLNKCIEHYLDLTISKLATKL